MAEAIPIKVDDFRSQQLNREPQAASYLFTIYDSRFTLLIAVHKKYTIEERVRWGDVDAARIIFYGAYIRFFEFAETELFRAVNLPYSVMFDELDVWLPRVHIECDFHHAAQLDDLLEVAVYVGRFGNKSMRLDFEVRRKDETELIATAYFVLASVRRDTFETVPMPQELRTRLAEYVKAL